MLCNVQTVVCAVPGYRHVHTHNVHTVTCLLANSTVHECLSASRRNKTSMQNLFVLNLPITVLMILKLSQAQRSESKGQIRN